MSDVENSMTTAETVKALIQLAERGVRYAEQVECDTNYNEPLFGPSDAEVMADTLEKLREPVAGLFVALSGKRSHASDCATSNAPAMMPGPCDCDCRTEQPDALHIVFDRAPCPEGAKFIEVETPDGRSVSAGEWHARPDGYHELRLSMVRKGAAS
ncbi:MAG: hypothetical protein ABGX08_02720 [Citromicrobium sp.]